MNVTSHTSAKMLSRQSSRSGKGALTMEDGQLLSQKFPMRYERIIRASAAGITGAGLLAVIAFTIATGSKEMAGLIFGLGVLLVFTLVSVLRHWFLADNVRDVGNALLVDVRGTKSRIELSDVANITHEWYIRGSRRVTIWLRQPSSFCDRISFICPAPMNVKEVIADLNERCGRQR